MIVMLDEPPPPPTSSLPRLLTGVPIDGVVNGTHVGRQGERPCQEKGLGKGEKGGKGVGERVGKRVGRGLVEKVGRKGCRIMLSYDQT